MCVHSTNLPVNVNQKLYLRCRNRDQNHLPLGKIWYQIDLWKICGGKMIVGQEQGLNGYLCDQVKQKKGKGGDF